MASPGTLRVGPYFLSLLAIFAVLYAIVFYPGSDHAPKLGLDLKGGAQVIYQAKTPDGKTPSRDSMTEARDIIEERVNGLGVAQAEVVVQGADEIVVSVPGVRGDQLANVGNAAKLDFRPVVMPPTAVGAQAQLQPTSPAGGTAPASGAPSGSAPAGGPATAGTGSVPAGSPPVASPAPSGASPQGATQRQLAAPTSSAPAPGTASATPAAPSPSAGGSAGTSPAPGPAPTAVVSKGTNPDPLANLGFPVPNSDADFSKLPADQQQALSAAMATYDCNSDRVWPGDKPMLACDSRTSPSYVYLLGSVIVPGSEISTAQAVAPNLSGTGGSAQWTVSLDLKSSGQKAWADYTSAHHSDTGGNIQPVSSCGASASPCAEYVAFVLDNVAISVPHNEAAINGTATQISGSFTQDSATKLANELKYGSLPLSFSTLTSTTVTATLGTAQLKAGFLAGGIGLALVVLYSLLYYRGLGLVTIASLVVSAGLTYASLVILGREIGFTLTLAGIAGFIVAVGITADSFVVFFERIKDEVQGGRSARTAVPRAWVRARRTILSADTVSFLAAAVLYIFAAGDVKGFAFTLGLSTILDLVVVFLFTHPTVSLLSRSAAFTSARFTGLGSARPSGARSRVVPAPSGAAERARARRGGADAAAEQRSAVAVLERDEDEPTDVPATDGAPDGAPAGEQSTPTARTRPDLTKGPSGGATAVAGPAGGTAAERAAARRARLRDQGTGAEGSGRNQKGNR